MNPEKPQRLRGWRARTLRVVLALAAPALFLLLAEGILRVAGFGRPTGFFVEWKTGGDVATITNQDFSLQFVPQQLSRAPEEIVLRPKGGESPVRIFVLGGSAAAGDPDPAFGFPRILETLLNRCSGGRSFEVVNAAVTAMNSHVVRHIAHDCAEHDPDVFIVYMGNNEVVGPYGPAALPSALYGSTGLIRAAIAARGSRVGQFLAHLAGAPGGPKTKWLGMEAFLQDQVPFDDARLQHCYEHFAANLKGITEVAADARAATLLCTVPTNTRSCPPFASVHRTGLAREQLDRWQRLFDEGRTLLRAKSFARALETLQAAAKIDDAYADLAFCLGTCAEGLGDAEAAGRHFNRARDLDTLRFRADSRINAAIRRLAKTAGGRSVALLDLEKMLGIHAQKPPRPGDLFLDHVHLTFRGNFLAAVAAAATLADRLPHAGIKPPQPGAETNALHDEFRGRLLYDVHAQFDLAMVMYRRKTRPPFVGQLDHDAEMTALRTKIIRLRRAVKQLGTDQSEQECLAALDKAPGDPLLNRRLGDLWLKHGKAAAAIERYRQRLKASPHDAAIRKGLASALAGVGRTDEAVEVLTSPANPFAMKRKQALGYVGTALIQHGQARQSEAVYRQVLEIDPEDADALINLGAAALQKGDTETAATYLHRALEADPASADAMGNLGNTFVKRGNAAEARKWFQKAVEADPYHHVAEAGLGLQLIREGRVAEGIRHLERSLALYPGFTAGYQVLAALYRRQGLPDKARRYHELAELFRPD